MSSTPNFSQFVPIKSQRPVLNDIINNYDYSLGAHEVLLSGSVGSAKSLTLAHIAIMHCLKYPGARFGIGRQALPKLKETLCLKIREHLHDSGIDYRYNETKGSFSFSNGSTMPAISWADGNLAKLGSYELSGMAVEEVTETKTKAFWDTLKMRVGRLPHVPEQLLIGATNPDSPGHWAYERIIEKSKGSDTIHTYYSKTFDNPFLPPSYTASLLDTLDEREAKRMVYGEWVELSTDVIYYAYENAFNYKNEEYKVNPRYPIYMCWDFNIGEGKPLSMCFHQYIGGIYHIFDEVIVEGFRTQDALDEMHGRGLLDHPTVYIIHGDATAKHKDTRSKNSDYEIIQNFLANTLNKAGRNIKFKMDVRRSNPPIRHRHNKMNAVICNANGYRRLFVYNTCPMVDKGLRLTKLKPGANYIEDDKDAWQHVTTAIGYSVHKIELDSAYTGPASGNMAR